jgi:hypothetical protein
VLDLLASGNPATFSGVNVDPAGRISDHCIITATLNVRPSVRRPSPYTSRNIKQINSIEFEQALRLSELFIDPATSADRFADQLVKVVTATLDQFAPKRTGCRRRPKPITRWLSADAVAAKRERRRLERRLHSTGATDQDRIIYRRSCRATNKLINKSRQEFYKQRIAVCTDSGKRWRIVNELLHTSTSNGSLYDEVGD